MSYSALAADLAPVAFPSSQPKALSKPLPGCVSQAVHDQAVKECSAAQQIRGLGVVGYESYGSPCRLVPLPICSPPARAYLPAAPAEKKNMLIVGGILVVLVAGGGYLAYRALKK